MNFDLTDDQRALVDTVEKFAANNGPKPAAGASAEVWVAATTARWQQMADLGLAGIVIAEEDGGIGMGMADAILVCEALGRSLAQEPFVTGAIVAPKLLETAKDRAMRSAQLRAIGEGSARITIASDEASLDFDPARISTRVQERQGGRCMTGVKNLVIDGATATHFVVTALDPEHKANAYLIAADQPGVTVTSIRGLGGGQFARVTFDGVEVDAPLFDDGAGLEPITRAIDHGTVALCAEALGLMTRMLSLTANYLQTRQQFGKAIGTFQALQHRFADMVVAAEQSRSATYMAAAALAGDDAISRQQEVSAAKSMVCRHGRAVLEAAIQLHGGIGITDEYELSRYVRRMLEIEKTWGDAFDHEARFGELTEA